MVWCGGRGLQVCAVVGKGGGGVEGVGGWWGGESRAVLENPDHFGCLLLRTALRDSTQGPPTANRQPPPTANRQSLK